MEIDHDEGAAAERGPRQQDDRISKLEDRVAGHILSFLPAHEAARAAALSRRWRHALATVHTLSLEEPESPLSVSSDEDDGDDGYSPEYYGRRRPVADPDPPTRFSACAAAAIAARHSHDTAASPAPPLRALHVALEDFTARDFSAVDQCVSYAMNKAGPAGLELGLRLRRSPLCCANPPPQVLYYYPDYAHAIAAGLDPPAATDGGAIEVDDDGDDVISDDEFARTRRDVPPTPTPEYTVPSAVFSCAALRTLRVGPCRLSPPAAGISLPSLETLLLDRVSDGQHDAQRLIDACPRLADLTLESCDAVAALSVFGARLRRLALRCCHNLTAVAVDASELDAFEYRGGVPERWFLSMYVPGPSGRWFLAMPALVSCAVEICGQNGISCPQEMAKLTDFLHRFPSARHLNLKSARLGSGIGNGLLATFPEFWNLRHLQLRGSLLRHDDDRPAVVVDAIAWILLHAPSLGALSLFFETGPEAGCGDDLFPAGRYDCKERELLDAHCLRYSRHSVLNTPTAWIPCLQSCLREINLVHYQGGTAQRTLAKFLLCNAPVVGELWCQFAEGPLWMQTELVEEMKGWVVNKDAKTVFR